MSNCSGLIVQAWPEGAHSSGICPSCHPRARHHAEERSNVRFQFFFLVFAPETTGFALDVTLPYQGVRPLDSLIPSWS
jgi:hypothetical protein